MTMVLDSLTYILTEQAMLIINIHYQNILFSTLNNFKKDKIAADYVKLLP